MRGGERNPVPGKEKRGGEPSISTFQDLTKGLAGLGSD